MVIVNLEGLGVKEYLSYEEVIIGNSERHRQILRNKDVAFLKILWRN